jgi:hypothetical protein
MLATPGQVSTFWVWGIAIVILGVVLAYGIAKSGRLRRSEREKLDRNTVATQQREDPRKSTKLYASSPPHMDYGVQMAHSNQGIVKTGRGEEQPVDKDRAQLRSTPIKANQPLPKRRAIQFTIPRGRSRPSRRSDLAPAS